MYSIYALVSEDTIWYVGKTIDPKNRLRQHKSGKDLHCRSRLIPKTIAWDMIILEDGISKENSTDYERFYMEFLEPTLNCQIPGLTRAETCALWEKKNPEKCRAKRKQLYDKDPEKFRARGREYYHRNKQLK